MKLRILAAFLFATTAGGIAALEVAVALGPAAFVLSPRLQALPTFSLAAMDQMLSSCDRALAQPNRNLLPVAVSHTYQLVCDARAREILAANRGHPYAMYIIALSADARGEESNALAWLTASSRAAPFEGWLSERRFAVLAGFDSPPVPSLEKEMSTLLTTQSGAELLIHHVRHRRGFVPIIKRALEGAQPSEQLRFRNAARRLGLENV